MAVAMEIDGDGNHQQHPINTHRFYTGRVSEDDTSHVRAHVSPTGVLTAAVSMETDVIYIEVCLVNYQFVVSMHMHVHKHAKPHNYMLFLSFVSLLLNSWPV